MRGVLCPLCNMHLHTWRQYNVHRYKCSQSVQQQHDNNNKNEESSLKRKLDLQNETSLQRKREGQHEQTSPKRKQDENKTLTPYISKDKKIGEQEVTESSETDHEIEQQSNENTEERKQQLQHVSQLMEQPSINEEKQFQPNQQQQSNQNLKVDEIFDQSLPNQIPQSTIPNAEFSQLEESSNHGIPQIVAPNLSPVEFSRMPANLAESRNHRITHTTVSNLPTAEFFQAPTELEEFKNQGSLMNSPDFNKSNNFLNTLTNTADNPTQVSQAEEMASKNCAQQLLNQETQSFSQSSIRNQLQNFPAGASLQALANHQTLSQQIAQNPINNFQQHSNALQPFTAPNENLSEKNQNFKSTSDTIQDLIDQNERFLQSLRSHSLNTSATHKGNVQQSSDNMQAEIEYAKTCEMCNMNFDDIFSLVVHIERVHGIRCRRINGIWKRMDDHPIINMPTLNSIEPENVYLNNQIGHRNFIPHNRFSQNNPNQIPLPYHCVPCRKMFMTKRQLNRHVMMYHDRKPDDQELNIDKHQSSMFLKEYQLQPSQPSQTELNYSYSMQMKYSRPNLVQHPNYHPAPEMLNQPDPTTSINPRLHQKMLNFPPRIQSDHLRMKTEACNSQTESTLYPSRNQFIADENFACEFSSPNSQLQNYNASGIPFEPTFDEASSSQLIKKFRGCSTMASPSSYADETRINASNVTNSSSLYQLPRFQSLQQSSNVIDITNFEDKNISRNNLSALQSTIQEFSHSVDENLSKSTPSNESNTFDGGPMFCPSKLPSLTLKRPPSYIHNIFSDISTKTSLKVSSRGNLKDLYQFGPMRDDSPVVNFAPALTNSDTSIMPNVTLSSSSSSNKKYQFRCSVCNRHFSNRYQAHKHATKHRGESSSKRASKNLQTSYAVPHGSCDSYDSQTFLLEQRSGENEAGILLGQVLVHLPVKEQVSQPVNVSITLTPQD